MARKSFSENFTEEKQQLFLQQIRQGMRRGAAIDIIYDRLNPDPYRRRGLREYIYENPEFEAAVLDAEVEATEHVEEALYQAAVSGSVPAAKTWLEMRGVGVSRRASEAPTGPHGASQDDQGEDPFGDLNNVTAIDPRRRRNQES